MLISGRKEPYFRIMNTFIKKYQRELVIGGITTLVIAFILVWTGFIITNFDGSSRIGLVLLNIISFVICWLFLSFLIHKLDVYKFFALVFFITIVLVVGRYRNIGSYPIIFPIIILLGIGAAYLIAPKLLKKYSLVAFIIYALIVVNYILYFNMGPDGSETYRLNFINSLLIPIPVFVGLWAYEQWRWFKTLQADKAKAELALLKSQVNPHFFFNTLNNLYGLVVEQSAHAPDVILKLSDMMRYTIYKGKEDLVSISEEVKYLESYIELHKIRYQKKVDIKFTHDIKKEIEVAPLLFIIFLENAIKHGVESMTENAFVHLTLKATDDKVHFKIENNFDPTSINKTKGIGLDNLKKRLEHIYPNLHELTISRSNDTYMVTLNISTNL